MIDLSVNGGYYVYGKRTFERKIDLYNTIWAEGSFIHSPISFWFHDELFSKQHWEVEPLQPITDLYKERAQQIRDKYDYLIIMFSGGSDSTNVLDTFINNGIHVDEVRTYYPIKRISNEVITPDPKHPLGLAFEYIYAALPRLKLLEKQSPKTKLSIVDISDILRTSIVSENEMNRSLEANLTVPNYHSIKMVFQTDDTEKHVESIKQQRTAVIYGADRPSLDLIDGQLVFFFTDVGCSCSCTDFRTQSNLSRINFYWTPDAPLIPIKQSHMIKRLLQTNRKIYDMANGRGKFNSVLHQSNLIRRLIYPTWNINTYQKDRKMFDDGLFDFTDHEKQASKSYNDMMMAKLSRLNGIYTPQVIEQGRHQIQSRSYKVADID